MTNEPKRPGRRPIDPAEVRRHNAATTLTDSERDAVDAARGTDTRSDWIRRAILEKLENEK